MNSRVLYHMLVAGSIATVVTGCTSGQRAPASEATDRAISAGDLGLTQLPIAPAVRRVWAGPEVGSDARPSADGRLFSATDWATGNLIVRDVANGTMMQVTSDASWESPMAFAETSIISPDGKSVAYGWYREKANTWELRIAGLSGPDSGKIRTAYSPPNSKFVHAHAWTPDGSEVIVGLTPASGTNQVAAIRVSDGALRILRTVDWRYPNNLAVSPDGRWIAYDFPTNGRDRDVHMIGVDGTGDRVVAGYKGEDVVMGWTGNDGRLLIGSERSGTPSVWSLRVVNGTPVGEPVLVRANMWRTIPVAATRMGTIFYLVSTGERGVYTVPIDPVTGAIRSKAATVTGENEQTSPPTSGWSADGDYMAYVVQRGGTMQMFGPVDVMVRSIKRGNVRRLSPRMSRIYKVQWLPNGRAMLLVGADEKGRYGLFRMDLGNASLEPLLFGEPGHGYPRNLTLSPDGNRIFFITNDSSDLLLHELDARGIVSVVRRFKNVREISGIAFSPDGRSLAVGFRGSKPGASRLIVVPFEGGVEREVYRPAASEDLRWGGISWSRDGRYLIFAVTAAQKDESEIRTLSLDDGKVSSTGFKRVGLRSLKLSPDGRTLLMSIDHYSMEMWAMEPPVFGSPLATNGADK